MFIRRTTSRKLADGTCYYTYRLVASERVGGQVRQRTLLNLGAHFALEREQWPLLCTRIEQLLAAQQQTLALGCFDEALEAEAQRIVAQWLLAQPALAPDTAQAKPDLQTIDVNSLELRRPRSVGVEHLGLWAMAQVDFAGLLRQMGLNGPQQAAVVGSIIGRMAAPGSEQATHRWLQDQSALGELIDFDYEAMGAMALYRASDRLYRHRDTLEPQLFERIRDLFDFACVITLYDLTHTFFEGAAAGNPDAQRGHSKEKRTDCPLLTLGMVLDGSGFVRHCQVLAGNVGESTTLKDMLEKLEAPQQALVVMDRGIATQANLDWLVENGYRYLVVSRERPPDIDRDAATAIETASDHAVYAQAVPSDDGTETFLYCYSEQRAKKEDGINQRFVARFEAALQKMHDGLAKPRTTKKIDKLWERIGRLKEKSHGIGQYYDITVVPDDPHVNAVAITWQQRPITTGRLANPGVYSLRTNETNWDADRLWHTYVMLTDLEAVFRSLKSELGLRPIFHHKPERSAGHLFITVLAYQFVQIIRRCLRAQDIHASWQTLRDTMTPQRRVTVTFRREDGKTLHVRKATQAEPKQRAIYRALGAHMAPGGVRKMIQ
ncbi:IS1634 family transposase [Salinisphaera sp. RV14]|uniref:IS1634 family transposase n=1 Tax=Salinisphaera sp. RV14 TaxID=3454140 RepID=UPI003F82BDD3